MSKLTDLLHKTKGRSGSDIRISCERLRAQGEREAARLLLKCASFWNVKRFVSVYLSHYAPQPFAQHHDDIFSAFPIGATGVEVNIIAPRGSAKSTCAATILPLYWICYRWAFEALDYRPIRYIIILSESTKFAKQRIKNIKEELEENEIIRDHFGDLVGPDTWNITEILTQNGIKVEIGSPGAQSRGWLFLNNRPSVFINDDLESVEGTRNPDIREANWDWFSGTLMEAGEPEFTSFINLATVSHQECIAERLTSTPGWKTIRHKAIISPDPYDAPVNEHLWRQWESIYGDINRAPDDRERDAQAFYEANRDAMMEGVVELWPDRLSYLFIRKETVKWGRRFVLREYQNVISVSSQIFDMENALWFDVDHDGLKVYQGLHKDNITRAVKWEHIDGASLFLDWAGGKDAYENAFAAAILVLWERFPASNEKMAYVIADRLKRVPPSGQVSTCFDLYEEYSHFPCTFAIEDFVKDTAGTMKETWTRRFNETKAARQGAGRPHALTLTWLKRNTNKIERIATLEPMIAGNRIAFNRGLSPEYKAQMEQFPTHEYLDAPDATEGAIRIMPGSRQSEHHRRIRGKREQAEQFRVRL